jgi:hypothetical protein
MDRVESEEILQDRQQESTERDDKHNKMMRCQPQKIAIFLEKRAPIARASLMTQFSGCFL